MNFSDVRSPIRAGIGQASDLDSYLSKLQFCLLRVMFKPVKAVKRHIALQAWSGVGLLAGEQGEAKRYQYVKLD